MLLGRVIKIGLIPRIAAINDLSGFGRCSLTVIMPVLSAMGMQVCPVPTAVLSTHTGGFRDIVSQDLTPLMPNYLQHWLSLGIQFDAVYSGYLGSKDQANFIIEFIQSLRNHSTPLCVVDPVMADNGKLYSSISKAMLVEMKRLTRIADVITPNYTEACILLDEEYHTAPKSEAEIHTMLEKLKELGPKQVIITSLPYSGGFCNAGLDIKPNSCFINPYDAVAAHYPGTGDLFTSLLTGKLLKGDTLEMATTFASSFVRTAVVATFSAGTPPRDGVLIEPLLGKLL